MEEALVDMQITSESLYGLMSLWSLFGDEFQHNQAKWDTLLADQLSLAIDGVPDWSTVLSLMMGIQDQSQVAVTSSG